MKWIIKRILNKLGYSLVKNDNKKENLSNLKNIQDGLDNAIKLNIGSGNWDCIGWKCLDYPSQWYASAQKGHDIIPYDIRKDNIPFDSNSVSAIYCSHVVEHIENEFIQKLFDECYRVLDRGGVFRCCCPDAEFLYKVSLFENDYWDWRKQWFASDFYTKGSVPRQLDFLVREIATPKLLGYRDSVNTCDYVDMFKRLDMNSFLEFLTHDLSFREECVGDHINWWTFDKMESFLKKSGFDVIIRSKYKGSVSAYMRDMNKFDIVHPEMALYVEAVKF